MPRKSASAFSEWLEMWPLLAWKGDILQLPAFMVQVHDSSTVHHVVWSLSYIMAYTQVSIPEHLPRSPVKKPRFVNIWGMHWNLSTRAWLLFGSSITQVNRSAEMCHMSVQNWPQTGGFPSRHSAFGSQNSKASPLGSPVVSQKMKRALRAQQMLNAVQVAILLLWQAAVPC